MGLGKEIKYFLFISSVKTSFRSYNVLYEIRELSFRSFEIQDAADQDEQRHGGGDGEHRRVGMLVPRVMQQRPAKSFDHPDHGIQAIVSAIVGTRLDGYIIGEANIHICTTTGNRCSMSRNLIFHTASQIPTPSAVNSARAINTGSQRI